jgi:hypothetical protein
LVSLIAGRESFIAGWSSGETFVAIDSEGICDLDGGQQHDSAFARRAVLFWRRVCDRLVAPAQHGGREAAQSAFGLFLSGEWRNGDNLETEMPGWKSAGHPFEAR